MSLLESGGWIPLEVDNCLLITIWKLLCPLKVGLLVFEVREFSLD